MWVKTLISNKESTAGRAALDVALWHEFPYQNWTVSGPATSRDASAFVPGPGTLPFSEEDTPRTEDQHLGACDGCAMFTLSPNLDPSLKHFASSLGDKGIPWVHLWPGKVYFPLSCQLTQFLFEHRIERLFIAGSLDGAGGQLYQEVKWALTEALFWGFPNQGKLLGGPGEG